MNGIINLMKPPGMTSNDAVTFARRLFSRTKTGHAGTLDPEAVGVLPILIGKATKLSNLLLEKRKTYIAEFIPGASTDTMDSYGAIIETSAKKPTIKEFERAAQAFVGRVTQIPPKYSALKIDGVAAYDRARRGETVTIPSREVYIESIDALRQDLNGSIMFEVTCGSGTYIRSLVNDIGESLGTKAHMGFLARTACGIYSIDDAVTLEGMVAASDNGGLLALLRPADEPFIDLPAAHIDEAFVSRATCGNAVPIDMLSFNTLSLDTFARRCRLYIRGEFAGIGELAGGAYRFNPILIDA